MSNIFYCTISIFVDNISIYPPSELCSGTYGKKASSKEKRLVEICEDLYRLDNQTIPAVREAFREYDVMSNMSYDTPIRMEYASKCAGKFIYLAERAVKALDAMHKKDEALNEYFRDFRLPPKGVEETIRLWTAMIVGVSVDGAELNKAITQAYKTTKESMK